VLPGIALLPLDTEIAFPSLFFTILRINDYHTADTRIVLKGTLDTCCQIQQV
jgi:hypothetical protein